MNLRNLTDEEMLSVSAVLLEETGEIYPVIHGHELLAGPTKVIARIHQELLTVRQQVGSIAKKVRELTDEMTRLDGHHDSRARGAYRYLEAAAELADTAAQEEEYTVLIETLFPEGLAITQRSYRQQSGTAKRVRKRITGEQRAKLEGLSVDEKSLWDVVEDWLETATTIARLEARRAELQSSDNDDAVSAQELRQARLQWIRAIRTLVDMMDFTDLEEDDRRVILANIKDADRKARQARLRAQERSDEPGADAADESDVDEPWVDEPEVDEFDEPDVDEPEVDELDTEDPEVADPV